MSDLAAPWTADLLVDQLLEAIAVPAWLHRDGEPMRANACLRRLCGLPQHALQATAHVAMVAADDRAALAAATHDCLHGSGQPPAQSARLLTADHSLRQVELTVRPVRWGAQTAALVTCVDHTDFHHVQTSLQAMSGLLQQIVNGAPVASFVIDRDHRVTHWNSACERLTGWPAYKMIGSTESWRAFYPSARPLLANMIIQGINGAELQALYGGRAYPSEAIVGAYEGETFFADLGLEGRWLNFTAAPLCDHDGVVIGAIETLQDVSQRRRADDEITRRLEQLVEERSAALAASARELEAFIDNAPIGVAYAANNRVQRCNRKMGEIFGLPSAQLVGLYTGDLHLSEHEHAEVGRIAEQQLAQGLPVQQETWMRHGSGRPIWVQLNAYVAKHQKAAAGAWWMLQDRTEMRAAQKELHARVEEMQITNTKLEQAQNQLLQADKMASIGQLAAGVAHEINNPVGFVSSNLNTLRQYVGELLGLVDAYAGASQAPTDPAAATRLASLQRTVELDYLKEDLPQLLDESADGLARVKKIVQDLKDFSRVDQADWQEADLNAGLESTLNVVRHEVKYRAEVVKHLAPLPPVLCLAAQLNQVFMNLIVNASQAITEHGVITLSSGTQAGWAWVQVGDSGCGMGDDVLRRIFEPFYTTKDVGRGTGLGLSLSFSIVQRHGGVIQARSTVGRGSDFRVWVPLAGPAAAGQTGSASPPDWHSAHDA